ncbi:MAG TPA: hypothetical protein EYP10_02305 [Armatimonadetes bacterium]|nr:hypothetical protein [Armatimonadota bacterium]
MKGLDVLVIESTYGRPEWSRPFEEDVERVLVDLVKEGLAEGSVAVYGYYGKLQEAMEILRAGGVSAPFVMPWKVYAVTRAAVRHGLKVTGYYLEGSDEARRAVSQDHYVYFAHLSRFGEGRGRHALSVVLSGWEFREPARRVDARTWLVALSDHADFRQLVEYVSRAKPGVVVVDSYRNGAAGELASFVREYLGIEAYVAPGSGVPLA